MTKAAGSGRGDDAPTPGPEALAAPSLHIADEPGPEGSGALIRIITVDRPAARNAIDVPTMRELDDAFAACASTPAVRVVVVTGAGEKAFVAGADIATLSRMSPAEARAFSALGHRVGERIATLPVPVIAAVNGYALGGGCELALACDLVYAADTARFGQPEVLLGAIPGFGGTQRLMRRVGIGRARELLLLGDTIDAAEALRIGLCDRVFEAARLMPETRRLAGVMAARAPLAVAQVKRALRDGADRPLAEANGLESELFAELFASADLALGMQAFLNKDKQPPRWRGR